MKYLHTKESNIQLCSLKMQFMYHHVGNTTRMWKDIKKFNVFVRAQWPCHSGLSSTWAQTHFCLAIKWHTSHNILLAVYILTCVLLMYFKICWEYSWCCFLLLCIASFICSSFARWWCLTCGVNNQIIIVCALKCCGVHHSWVHQICQLFKEKFVFIYKRVCMLYSHFCHSFHGLATWILENYQFCVQKIYKNRKIKLSI